MAIPTYNYTWQQGEDGVISMVYSVDGTPVNLTTYSVRMDVRSEDGTWLYTFNSSDIVEVPPVDTTGSSDNEAVLGTAGQINITVPRSASLAGGKLTPEVGNTLLYDVFLRNPASKQKKILKGTILIEPSQTRWQ